MELQFSQALVWERQDPAGWQGSIQHDLVSSRDTALLEERLCHYVGAEHCVSVSSATTGMLLALKTAGIESGDAVLCTTFSYFATAEIIALAGGKPMFVDINPNTYSIDPYCLEYVIGKCIRTRQPVPKALIAVDLFGLPCNYDALEEICERHGIILIEDMAQSFGATYKDRKAGSFGRMAVASFFPAKPLGELGEGGAVFCHTPRDAQRLLGLRRKVRLEGDGVLCSGGSHLDTVQASLVGEKLAIFDQELARRRQVADRYYQRLEGKVRLQLVGPDFVSAHTQFAISLKSASARAEMIDRLQDCHIPCHCFEPSPVRGRGRGNDWDKVALVNAQSVAQRILTIPIHPYLSERVVDYICDHILEDKHPEPQPAPEKEKALVTEK